MTEDRQYLCKEVSPFKEGQKTKRVYVMRFTPVLQGDGARVSFFIKENDKWDGHKERVCPWYCFKVTFKCVLTLLGY